MATTASILITLGALFLAALGVDVLARWIGLPRVTFLLLLGVAAGPTGLGVLTDAEPWGSMFTEVALVMVGFLLGGHLLAPSLKARGRRVLGLSVGVVIATVAVVAVGSLALGIPLGVALLLGGVATATDPVATLDVVEASDRDDGFTRDLLSIVAIDDAWGLIAFSLLLAAAEALNGATAWATVGTAAWELGGSLLLGLALGVPGAYLTGRLDPGEPTLVEALGLVLLCAGLARLLGVSILLSAVALGTVLANLARHHERPFHEVEGIDWPFLVIFFVLAGASFEPGHLATAGLAGVAYLALRVLGRLAGGEIAGRILGVGAADRRWLGLSLLPQAGVAVGMALLAAERLPSAGGIVLPIAVGSTVVFEIAGPILTRIGVARASDAPSPAPMT